VSRSFSVQSGCNSDRLPCDKQVVRRDRGFDGQQGDWGKEVQAGETGELWLKGPNVFQGYWKNEEATKNAITSDGYFKTGDVGHQDKDHNFYITDRMKELIKWNGFQVAPAGKPPSCLAYDDFLMLNLRI